MEDQRIINFTGKLYRVLYQAENTGFTVALYDAKDPNKMYKCVGNNLPVISNVDYSFKVIEKPDIAYGGTKYDVISFEMKIDKGRDGIIGFLSSGLFKGIGPKMAAKIYDKFGDKTLAVIKEDPDRLSYVKGLSRKKALALHESFLEESGKADLYAYLSKYGLSSGQIKNAMKAHHGISANELLEKIKENPYILIYVSGITFDTVDIIGRENNVPENAETRIFAAVITAMKDLMQRGHVGLELSPVINATLKLLNSKSVDANKVKNSITAFIYDNRIKYRRIKLENSTIFYIYLPAALQAENELSEAVKKMLKSKVDTISDIDISIQKIEKKEGITLDASQKQAIEMALNNPLSIITGGPGTGKTTIVKAITEIWEERKKEPIVLLSPTGRAARNLEEKTGLSASTIHSHYGLDVGEEHYLTDESTTDEDSLIIIDEMSMLDIFVARDAFQRIHNSTVVLIGDPDQLPSVSPGNVLFDLIRSGAVPVTKLKYIHRQGAGSMIRDNADKIRKGITPLTAASDFRIFELKNNCTGTKEEILSKIELKLAEEYLKAVGTHGLMNVVCLVPFNKYPCGQLSLNKILQAKLNPLHPIKGEIKGMNGQSFRVGDPVMQLKNQGDVSNGDVGRVIWTGKRDGQDLLLAKFFDTTKEYDRDNIEELCLAYAMTVHKSQGSEYDVVVTALSNYHAPMIRRNILYTAVTRAKKNVVLCGSMDAVNKAIMDNTSEKRNSLLWYNIQEKKEVKEEKEEAEQLCLPGIFA